MRALSVRQPWASLIVHRHKPIENRTWQTSYRGPLLIHASQTLEPVHAFEHLIGSLWTLPRGGFVGRVRLVEIVTQSNSPWFSGPFGWVLAEPELVTFKRARGFVGLFDPRRGRLGAA